MAKNRRDRRRRTMRKNRRDRRERRDRRRSMRGGLVMSPSPINESLANSWSSKASLNQGGDFFKYHKEQHGGAAMVGAPFPNQVVHSVLPSEMAGTAHLNGINKAYNEIVGLNDREGTPAIVPSQSGGPANTTGGRRRGTRRNRRDRRRKLTRRNRNRRAMYGGNVPLGYSSVNAPTMLLPDRASYAAAALNPEYVNMKGYAEGISAQARDAVGYA